MRRLAPLIAVVVAGCASTAGVAGTSPPSTSTTTTAVATTTTAASTTITAARSRVCDGVVEEPVVLGTITDGALFEVSGITRSARSPGMLWVHNDSGAPPLLWAVAADGTVLGHQEVRARNVDWEDVAIGPGLDGAWWIYIGDIGDNFGRRSQVWLYRFPEPATDSGVVDEVESLLVTYPDGPADAEALLVDPVTGDAFIVTKTASGRSSVLRIPVGAWAQDAAAAEQVARVDVGALAFVTAGDISEDGSVIAIRTYGDVWLWERGEGETVADAMSGPPCLAPAAEEPQGESIALEADGYVTVSEGEEPVVYRFVGVGG